MISTLIESGIRGLVADAPPSLQAFYRANNAPEEIINLVGLSNKRFGSVCESLVTTLVGGEKVPDQRGKTGWDMELTDARFEIKSSRYWRSGKNQFFKWQHVLPDHEWSHLLLCAVDFDRIRLFALNKPTFMSLIEIGKITQQGGAGGQGCWFEIKHIIDTATEITGNTKSEYNKNLLDFIDVNPASNAAISQEHINKSIGIGKLFKEKKK
jgi:hypothetical protein